MQNTYQTIIRSGHYFVFIIAAFFFMSPAAGLTKETAVQGSVTVCIVPERIEQGSVARIMVICPASVQDISYTLHTEGAILVKDSPGQYSGFLPIATSHKTGPANLTITVRYPDSTTTTLNAPFEVIAKEFPVQRLTIDESKNTLSEKNLARHNSERALIIKMFNQSKQEKLWQQSFSKPLRGRLSTPFGVKRIINDEPRNPHSGVDIAAPLGTPVKATASGQVSLTGEHFFAGKSIYIDHGQNIFSMYFHLDSIAVHEGQTLAQGDIIGQVGQTGRATGPHLHWGLRIDNTPIDPFSLLTLFENQIHD